MESLPRRAEGSSVLAHVLTILLALVLLPLSTLSLAFGTNRVGPLMIQSSSAPWELAFTAETVTGLLAVGAGLLLLALLALSGIASSAGLLVVAALSVLEVLLALWPSLLLTLTQQSFGRLDLGYALLQWTSTGVPLLLHLLLGGAGIALVVARRRPDPPAPASRLGIVVVPALMLVGSAFLLLGAFEGMQQARRILGLSVPLRATVLLLLGAVLVLLSAAGTRWSPWSSILPMIALLGLTALWLLPATRNAFTADFPGVLFTLLNIAVCYGGTIAAALLLGVHTAVLAVVRHRARRHPSPAAG
jgi:hypothetical protein